MTLRSLRRFSALAILLGIALASAKPAQATLAVNIQEGSSYMPGGPNLTLTPLVGNTFAFGGSTTNFTVSGAVTPTMLPTLAALDLQTLDTTSTAAGKLFVTATDTGYSLSAAMSQLATAVSQLTSHFVFGGGTSELKAWVNSSNLAYAMTGPLVTDIMGPNGSQTSSSPPSLSNPFSITIQLILTTTGASQYSSDGSTTVTSVPEPGTMAAALAGLPLAYMGLRSRRRKA